MNQQIENDVKPISTPEDAISEFVGEQFIEWLMEFVAHEMKNWPGLAKLQNSKPKIEKIRKFILQRYIAAQAFTGGREGDPGFLGFAIANLSESPDPEAESALTILESKKQDEFDGQPTGHGRRDQQKELWLKPLYALGATDEEINRAEPKEWTRNYIAELSDLYSNGEWQEVAGAFAAYEKSVPEEYKAICDFLRTNTQLSEENMEVLVSSGDVKYGGSNGHLLEKIVFDPANKKMVWQGAVRELEIRKEFFAGQIQHLEN